MKGRMQDLLSGLQSWQPRAVLVAGFLLACSVTAPVHATFAVQRSIGFSAATSAELFLTTAPTGMAFEAPGATGISVASWSGDVVNPTYLLMQGTSGSSVNFDMVFSGDLPTAGSYVLDSVFWSGDVLTGTLLAVNTYVYHFDGPTQSSFTEFCSVETDGLCSSENINSFDRTPAGIPEPAILALMSLGLAGIGYQRRKQIKAA